MGSPAAFKVRLSEGGAGDGCLWIDNYRTEPVEKRWVSHSKAPKLFSFSLPDRWGKYVLRGEGISFFQAVNDGTAIHACV